MSSRTSPLPALLVLKDGRVFRGRAMGHIGRTQGELVFNTSLTGYQEVLTDPSYSGQIVTFTYPEIGNVGVNEEDNESRRAWVSGMVIRSLSPTTSNYRATQSLTDYLKKRQIVGISDIDTRALVRHLRTEGAQMGLLTSDPADILNPDAAIAAARALGSMSGQNLVPDVSCDTAYAWVQQSGALFNLEKNRYTDAPPATLRVVAYDFGVKQHILRHLAARGISVEVVPWNTRAEDVLAKNPDGIFLSNGPGDPAAATQAIENIRALIGKRPIFGICLGHQLLALALGGKTFKLKFGHRGGNHPVRDNTTGKVEISSQNHGFAVCDTNLPNGVAITHINLNDHTVEGLEWAEKYLFSVQYHPEASPGPNDSVYLFDRFIDLMKRYQNETRK